MNKKKILRCFSVLLALSMLMAMLPAGAYAADAWDGSIDVSWYNTTDTSFTIMTPAQLAGLAAIVNGTADGIEKDSFAGKTITLGADIDLGNKNWTPIGRRINRTDYYSFAGEFFGNDHAICNMSIVYDVKSQLDPDDNSLQFVGSVGLFGSVEGTELNRVVINNLSLRGNITITSEGEITPADMLGFAGLIGRAKYVSIVDCTVCVEITNESTLSSNVMGIGGIVGAGEYVAIDGCANLGDIYGGKSVQVGGLGGSLKPTSLFDIKDSYNTGNVSAFNLAGGLFGFMQASTGSSICNCINTGVISTNSTGKGIGAIGGQIAGTISNANGIYYLEGTCQKAVGGGKLTTTVVSRGDVSLNDFVDEQDVTYLIGHIIGSSPLNSSQIAVGDMNGDGRIDENDVTYLIQTIIGTN